MKLALLADIHLRGKDLPACDRQLMAVVRTIILERCDAVIICGDVFDNPGIGDDYATDGAILEVILRALTQLSEAGIPVHVIGGDHDTPGAGRESAILGLAGVPGVEIYTDPRAVELLPGRPVILAALPWSWNHLHDPEQAIERLIEDAKGIALEEGQARKILLACHISITGLLMNAKRAADPVADRSTRARSWVVSRDFLDGLIEQGRVQFIRCGDFHIRHEHYVGALRQLNHGEEGNPQGFEITDTSSGERRWIEVEEAPRYRTFEVAPGGEDVINGVGEDNVKVRFNAEPDPGIVRQLEAHGVTVERIVERVERKSRADIPEGILNDDDAIIREHYRSQGIDDETLKRDLGVFHDVMAGKREETKAPEREDAREPVAVTADEELPF